MKKYPEYKQLNLPQISKEVLKFWEEHKTFEKSVSTREGKTPWVFYEGPPSANGMPGIHHVMARAIKDIFCRFKTLQGYQVKRKAGWDTHGLPIELGVEKSLGITKEDIGNKNSPKYISVEDYNKACRKEVMKYTDKWEQVTAQMGYWVDMSDPYITYDNKYIESVWWLLNNLYKKDLLYKGYTIQPYSPAAGTGLSSHELNQPGCYRDVKDRTATVMFKFNPSQEVFYKTKISRVFDIGNGWSENAFLLAWTTTPWTLPSNTALAVGGDIKYVAVRTFNQFGTGEKITVVLAENLVNKYFPEKNKELKLSDYKTGDKNIPFEIEEVKYTGYELEGIRYEQLLDFVKIPVESNALRVIIGDFVTTQDGTGIVHIAPTFGSDDYRVAQANNIPGVYLKVVEADGREPIKPLVDERGRFLSVVQDNIYLYGEEYVKEAYLSEEEKKTEFEKQKKILEAAGKIKDLKVYLSVDERIVLKLQEEGKLFKKETYEHSYPHCWRTDKPVLYYPLDSWFIKSTAAKDRMIELNKTINWKPEATGTGRFGNWLENLNDWNLSRSRFWGIPIPIWTNLFTGDRICIGQTADFKETSSGDGRKCNGYFLDKSFESFFKLVKEEDPKTINEIKLSLASEKQIALGSDEAFDNHVNSLIKSIQTSDVSALFNLPKSHLFKYLIPINDEFIGTLDLHKPYIDKIYFYCEDNDTLPQRHIYIRESDLIDVWFDSGAMPFAQMHFPFENVKEFSENYPADFIAEGVDQTRGWFFTLHAISCMLKEEVQAELKKHGIEADDKKYPGIAYKNVVSNGLVLDKNGNKMSKRLGNAVDPFETLEKYGADATRWYMIANAAPWDNLKFDIEGISEVQRQLFGTLYNTYGFYALYANVDGFLVDEKNVVPLKDRQELDRWILSKLNSLIKDVTLHYENFEPHRAARSIEEFVDEHLSNWYVRLGRRRFWKGEMSVDKKAAYETLHECLKVVSQLMSPIAPFFGEWLYQNLSQAVRETAVKNNTSLQFESVHLTQFVKAEEGNIDLNLEQRMEMAQKISSMILSIRKKENLRVRQPLQKIQIPILDKDTQAKIEAVKDLILAEVNVKEIEFVDESKTQIVKNLKLNFKTLGKKCGANMKAVQAFANDNGSKIISDIEKTGKYVLNVNGSEIILETEDVEIIPVDIPGWKVANNGPLTVALDVTISEALKQEGLAREIVNRIQNLRKDKGLDVTDRILVKIKQNEALNTAINNNLSYICSETLTGDLQLVADLTTATANAVDVDETISTLISIEKLN